jgi:homoserine O-acetyltransferase
VKRGRKGPVRPHRLVHETWGDHAALLALTEHQRDGSVGWVEPQSLRVATPQDPLTLEHGSQLLEVDVAFETYGALNAERDNAVLVCHALTGSAHAAGRHARGEVPGWWDPLIGPGKAIDTTKLFVVCSNVLGGCYGTTGPTSVRPDTGEVWGPDFPRFTIRDMVHVQARLLDKLGVNALRAVWGGSMGGMQALEWAALYPERVRSLVAIGIGGRHSAWAIGLNEVARRAIAADPAFNHGRYPPEQQPETGLGLARAIAMLSYRSFDSLQARFGRGRQPDVGDGGWEASFQIASYLQYQGVKLAQRFDANSYMGLTRAMDEHDLSHGRGKLSAVLRGMTLPTLVMGIPSDVLYPEVEQRELLEGLPNAQYARIVSPHGHDAFLIEFPQVSAHIRRFIQQVAGG